MEFNIDDNDEDVFKGLGYLGKNDSYYGIAELLEKNGLTESAHLTKLRDATYANRDGSVYTYTVNGRQRWCAEISYQTDVDDYNVETLFFSRCPSDAVIDLVWLCIT